MTIIIILIVSTVLTAHIMAVATGHTTLFGAIHGMVVVFMAVAGVLAGAWDLAWATEVLIGHHAGDIATGMATRAFIAHGTRLMHFMDTVVAMVLTTMDIITDTIMVYMTMALEV